MRIAALCALLAACASAPPDAARIVTQAENGEARIVRVDGARVIASDTLTLAPGRHRLVVYCRYNLGIMIGDAQSAEREIEAELAPGGRYRIDAGMTPAPCTLALTREDS
jgi:type IV pilus biogenesis protein CpaD/CtpE